MLQNILDAAKMVLDMNTEFNTLLHFLHRNVTIIVARAIAIYIFLNTRLTLRARANDETHVCINIVWTFRDSYEFKDLNF